MASISRMPKNIGLFCKRALQKRPIFCKETYIFKHPINGSHPIWGHVRQKKLGARVAITERSRGQGGEWEREREMLY